MNAQGGACWLLFQFFWTSWWGIFFLLFPNCLALFSLFGSSSSTSLFLYSLFILSLKLPDHPHWYWPEPVWLVSVEGGRSFSTCVLSICSLGRMSLDPHLFWPAEDVFVHLYPELGCGIGVASPSLLHSTTSPQYQTGSLSVTSCGEAFCSINPMCHEAEQQSRLFTLPIHTINQP